MHIPDVQIVPFQCLEAFVIDSTYYEIPKLR